MFQRVVSFRLTVTKKAYMPSMEKIENTLKRLESMDIGVVGLKIGETLEKGGPKN